VVLARLIEEGLNTYTQVAATVQAFINDPETILSIIASGQLERSLEDLREMESVKIDVDPQKEALVPRPDPGEELLDETREILDSAAPLLDQYSGTETTDIASALTGLDEGGDEDDVDFGQFVPKAGAEADWE
jgi:flagellar protein FlaI